MKKPTTTGVRRYKIGTEPIYDRKFEALKSHSQILTKNDNVSAPAMGTAINLNDRSGLETQLVELIGGISNPGHFFNLPERKWMKGQLIVATDALNQIEHDFLSYQQQKVNNGYERPEEMPKEMRERQLELEAQHDVLKAETEKLQMLLKTKFTDPEEAERKAQMLRYGMQQASKGSPPYVMDGQRCGIVNGLLCIDDPASPYDGMMVQDYRKLSSEWCKARNQWMAEVEAKYKAEILANGRSDIVVPDGLRPIDKSTLPKWPAWAVNHKAKK